MPWPTIQELRKMLRLQPDPNEDQVLQWALDAAVDYGNRKTTYRYDPTGSPALDPPAVVHEACLLDAARIYRRRDSIDGTISWGDMGAVRVGRADPDVDRLYSSVAPLVFG
jgi:hypothetical protein